MTTAKRTTLVRVLNLSIGYEEDISPATVAGAVLEALEATLIDEMGITFVKAASPYAPNGDTLTIYAPLDKVRLEAPSDPPQTPSATFPSVLDQEALDAATKVCPDCGKNAKPLENLHGEEVKFGLCDDCERKPNL